MNQVKNIFYRRANGYVLRFTMWQGGMILVCVLAWRGVWRDVFICFYLLYLALIFLYKLDCLSPTMWPIHLYHTNQITLTSLSIEPSCRKETQELHERKWEIAWVYMYGEKTVAETVDMWERLGEVGCHSQTWALLSLPIMDYMAYLNSSIRSDRDSNWDTNIGEKEVSSTCPIIID